MSKAKVVFALVIMVIAMSSCMIRKRDRCPQVGEAHYGITEKK